jgi:hypothetical protein
MHVPGSVVILLVALGHLCPHSSLHPSAVVCHFVTCLLLPLVLSLGCFVPVPPGVPILLLPWGQPISRVAGIPHVLIVSCSS